MKHRAYGVGPANPVKLGDCEAGESDDAGRKIRRRKRDVHTLWRLPTSCTGAVAGRYSGES